MGMVAARIKDKAGIVAGMRRGVSGIRPGGKLGFLTENPRKCRVFRCASVRPANQIVAKYSVIRDKEARIAPLFRHIVQP
ncbi:hypothetical protein TK43_06935 [Roseovarius sp. JS7-11]|jgi:hypothetical protein|nr:hypothetical protein TK43_06935 [Roseovarius sp. JS7-11]